MDFSLDCVVSFVTIASEALLWLVWVIDGTSLLHLFFTTHSGDRREITVFTDKTLPFALSATVFAVFWQLLSWLELTASVVVLEELLQTSLAENWSVVRFLVRSVTARKYQLHTRSWAGEIVTVLTLSTGIDVGWVFNRSSSAVCHLQVFVAESVEVLLVIRGNGLSVSTSGAPRFVSVGLAEVAVVGRATVVASYVFLEGGHSQTGDYH